MVMPASVSLQVKNALRPGSLLGVAVKQSGRFFRQAGEGIRLSFRGGMADVVAGTGRGLTGTTGSVRFDPTGGKPLYVFGTHRISVEDTNLVRRFLSGSHEQRQLILKGLTSPDECGRFSRAWVAVREGQRYSSAAYQEQLGNDLREIFLHFKRPEIRETFVSTFGPMEISCLYNSLKKGDLYNDLPIGPVDFVALFKGDKLKELRSAIGALEFGNNFVELFLLSAHRKELFNGLNPRQKAELYKKLNEHMEEMGRRGKWDWDKCRLLDHIKEIINKYWPNSGSHD